MSRLILRTAMALLIAATLQAEGGVTDATLKGIRGVKVVVDLNSDAEEAGLRKSDIQTDVELKLRLAGIKVLAQEEWLKEPGSPLLAVNANLLQAGKEMPGLYAVSVELLQGVTLVRDLSMTMATTWRTEAAAIVGQNNPRPIRDTLGDQLDKFLNAYLSVNPKK